MVLGFDQGFSSVKVSSAYGEFKFANAIQEVNHAGNLFYAGSSSASTTYEYNEKQYVVGDKAGVSSKINYYRDVKYLMDYAPVMLAAAIYRLKEQGITKDNITDLSVGLPLENVSYMNEYRDILQNHLERV